MWINVTKNYYIFSKNVPTFKMDTSKKQGIIVFAFIAV